MTPNVGTLDRIIRIILGLVLIGLAYTGILGTWAYIGIVLLATGLLRWCGLYTLLGLQTCPLTDQLKR